MASNVEVFINHHFVPDYNALGGIENRTERRPVQKYLGDSEVCVSEIEGNNCAFPLPGLILMCNAAYTLALSLTTISIGNIPGSTLTASVETVR